MISIRLCMDSEVTVAMAGTADTADTVATVATGKQK